MYQVIFNPELFCNCRAMKDSTRARQFEFIENWFMNKINDEVASILSTSEINEGKYWSRKDGDIHAPHGFSTIDVLNTLGEK